MSLQFNKDKHEYSKNGVIYQSVTQYLEKFKPEFPRDLIASKVADKENRTLEDVLAEWEFAGDLSKDFGNAIHKSIECFIKYKRVPKQNYLKQIVDEFAELTKGKELKSEVVVWDDELKIAGTIDLIEKVGDKKVKLIDFKTNGDFKLKGGSKLYVPFEDLQDNHIDTYSMQLSLYKELVERKGYTVVGMEIWHYDDKFNIYKAKEINYDNKLHYL